MKRGSNELVWLVVAPTADAEPRHSLPALECAVDAYKKFYRERGGCDGRQEATVPAAARVDRRRLVSYMPQ